MSTPTTPENHPRASALIEEYRRRLRASEDPFATPAMVEKRAARGVEVQRALRQRERELTPATVLYALRHRRGRANGLTAEQLVELITGDRLPADVRRLRHVVEHLRLEGHAVCALPSSGYYLAATAEDLDLTCNYLYARAMTSLRQIGQLKRRAVPDLRGQLGLPMTDEPIEEADQ